MRFSDVLSGGMAFAGAMLLTASQVAPDSAISNLSGWAHQLGLANVTLPAQADHWAAFIGLSLIVLGIVWLLNRGPAEEKFNELGFWSVSIDMSGVGNGELKQGGCFILLEVRLTNLSNSQGRVFDLDARIRPRGGLEPVLLESRHSPYFRRRDEMIADGVPVEITSKFLNLPVDVPPNAVVEGTVEFTVFPHHGDLTQSSLVDVQIFERRSGLRKTLAFGQCYDAKKQKIYYGTVGHPIHGIGAWWRRYQWRRANKGKTIVYHGY